MKQGNLLLDSFPDSNRELFETLVQTGKTRVERIISSGQSSPEGFWYDQHEHEFVLILQGTAVIGFESGRRVALEPGTWLHIKPRQRHRVVETSTNPQTIWLALFWTADESAES